MSNPEILFLAKRDDRYAEEAESFLRRHGCSVQSHYGIWGDSLPEEVLAWSGHYVISYLSRWVVPPAVLERARIAALNFHPAPPEYPGIGCNNFALYDGAEEFGVTCHHMARRVDSGAIIAVKRFPLYPGDDVNSLLRRTYHYQLQLFYDIADLILNQKPLPVSDSKWARRAITRQEFEALFEITCDMPAEEVERRIRAVSYGKFKPYVDIAGFRFQLVGDE